MASKYGWQLIQKPAMSVTMISTWGNHSQVTRGGRKQGIKLKAGKKRQLQKGTMLITLWYDKRQVAVLSSNCNPNEQITVQRCVKTALHVKEVEILGPVHVYNRSMGGVDLNDQYRSYYPSGCSGKKWW